MLMRVLFSGKLNPSSKTGVRLQKPGGINLLPLSVESGGKITHPSGNGAMSSLQTQLWAPF